MQRGTHTEAKGEITRFFSGPLWKQDIKSNWVLILVITVLMILMSTVMTYATSVIGSDSSAEDTTEAQSEFYSYLGGIAAYDQLTGGSLSYDDFVTTDDTSAYETAFAMINTKLGKDFSVDGFQNTIDTLKTSDVPMEDYVKQFEYAFALEQSKGCFTGDDLSIDDLMDVTFSAAGVNPKIMETMSTMDSSTLLNSMYFRVAGLLPIFLLIVILANSLIVSQVDRGSMAYVLSTPTRRSAVTNTQALFMIVVPLIVIALVCVSKVIATSVFIGEVDVTKIAVLYGSMYLLVEAVAAICYMGSCIFNRSRSSLAFGGGLTVWFFLASLLGMYGSDTMVNMGIGVKELGYFNNMTLVGLFDTDAISTLDTGNVDLSFLWKLGVLVAIAIVCYLVGAKTFQKKDLPL